MIKRSLLLLLLLGGAAHADEGMWLFNQLPTTQLEQRYGFKMTPAWSEHVMHSCVRFNNGGSGSLVSDDGLVITNHHIGSDSLQKLSTPGRDLIQTGYFEPKELPCPDLELDVLQSIEVVTDKVEAGGTDEGRRAAISALEKSENARTGLHCEVVTLYLGGAYHLYRYKRYTDVRLVMAPEQRAAFFGGDVDNFEYPRHDFDVCFFRIYENGQPLKGAPHLQWRSEPVKSDELVFVAGHPGRTNRLETMARLEHLRDRTLPLRLSAIRSQELALRLFSQRGLEQKRQAQARLYSVANGRKAYLGQFQALLDHELMKTKAARENAQRTAVAGDPHWKGLAGEAWTTIATSEQKLAALEAPWLLLEGKLALQSTSFDRARHLLRWSQEKSKPSGQRLPEYRDSNLDSLWLEVLSPAPVFPEAEEAQLTASLGMAAEVLGAENADVQSLLQGKSAEARAAELVQGTRLADLGTRKTYRDMSQEQLLATGDPMIALAAACDASARAWRKKVEAEVSGPETRAYAQVARSQMALGGKELAPDATFTLRLAFGKVSGYSEPGRSVPFATTLGDAFRVAEQHGNEDPYRLPDSWMRARSQLELTAPYDFVSTADTIGGNSGSPVVDREARVVGINFDRNRYGLSRNFLYTDAQARHVAVSAPVVLQLLDKVYGCSWLANELRQGHR